MRATTLLGLWFLASAGLAQPELGLEDPPHPGGRVELRHIVSGPLEADDVTPVLSTLPPRLTRCARARLRGEGATAAGHDFHLLVEPSGRVRVEGLDSDPRDRAPLRERRWLACARRVLSQLRFAPGEAPSDLHLSLVWMRDDRPHGDGLL